MTTPTFFPIVGGAELLIRDVLNLWSESDEVRLVTSYPPESSGAYWVPGMYEATCRFDVVRFHDRHSLMDWRGHRASRGMLPPMSLSALSAIDRQIETFGPDVLVTFFGVPFGLPSVILHQTRRLPLVLVLCGNDIPGPRTRRLPGWARYVRRAAAAADRTVYVSRFCCHALEKREPREPHDVVIPGGVDLAGMQSTGSGAVERIRRSLGLGEEDVMLFALQRLAPEKRVDVLVRAFAALPASDRRVVLVIGGQGSESERLGELARSLGVADRVVLTGHVAAEKADYYRASDVFVFHSIFETFGQVIAEAMVCGKPVVSVRAGSIPELVDDGETGLLAEPNDPDGLARAIEHVVADPLLRHTLGKAGRAKATREYNWDVVAPQWRGLLAFADRRSARTSSDATPRRRVPGAGVSRAVR